MIGSVCYSLSSFFYMILVTRICGVVRGGVFALAFATAQLLLTLGRYGMRTFQATDASRQYSFREYGATRIVTCGAMVLLSVPYCLVRGYPGEKTLVFLLAAGLKMIDAAEDVFHGELQRSGHVARMGQLLAARNVFSCAVFGAVLAVTRDLTATCLAAVGASLAFCLVFNGRAVKRCCPRDGRLSGSSVRKLFVICFPIFLSTFLSLFLYNIPKYAIDQYMSEEFQTYYGILFMPSFVITLFSEIVTRPVMTALSVAWDEDTDRFARTVGRIFLLILAGTAAVTAGGHFIGRRLLELIYGVDLRPYRMHFIILLVGGGLSAAVYVSYNLLIAIRAQRSIIAVYLAVSAAAVPLTYLAVSRHAMMGAAWSYFFTCLALEAFFGTSLAIRLKNKRTSREDNR